MGRQRLKYVTIQLAIVAAVLGTLAWFFYFRREHTRWTETVSLSDGTTARAEVAHSHRVYWSFGHVGGFGGGDRRSSATIHASGKVYHWSGGDEDPIVLARRDGQIFMAVFDRTDMSAVRYRYFRNDSANYLREIPPAEFPRELAVQNLWLDAEAAALLSRMDPENGWFRQSLTARMWLHLVHSVDYHSSFAESTLPSSQFIREYKAKYLQPQPSPATQAGP